MALKVRERWWWLDGMMGDSVADERIRHLEGFSNESTDTEGVWDLRLPSEHVATPAPPVSAVVGPPVTMQIV